MWHASSDADKATIEVIIKDTSLSCPMAWGRHICLETISELSDNKGG
jgi:hypothetical protein